MEALTHSVTIFGDRTSKEVTKVKSGHKGGALIRLYGVLVRRGRHRMLCVQREMLPEITVRRLLSGSQKEGPPQKPTLPAR